VYVSAHHPLATQDCSHKNASHFCPGRAKRRVSDRFDIRRFSAARIVTARSEWISFNQRQDKTFF